MMRTTSTTTMVAKLEADTVHVEHVQDFWGDPLTEAGAQSNDLKAAYVQVYLAGNQGEALANESVKAVQAIVAGAASPGRGQGLRDRRVGAGGRSADRRRPQRADHRVRHVRRHHPDAAPGVPVDRHRRHRARDGVPRAFRGPRCGGLPRLPRPDRALDVRDQPSGDPGDRRLDRLRDLPRRAVSGGPNDRPGPGVGLLHDVPRHRACGAGLRNDDRRCDVLPVVHPAALLPVAGRPAGGRDDRGGLRGTDPWARGDHRRQPFRAAGTQARHAHSWLATVGRRRGPVAGRRSCSRRSRSPWSA